MRYKAKVAYHGGKFKGWQIQPGQKTVQGDLELALQKLYQENIRIHASGRTDTGVHAKAQMIHFDTENDSIPTKNIQAALNSQTDKTIAIYDLESTSNDFHARYSEHHKTYRYYFDLNNPANPMYLDRCYHIPNANLDYKKMKEFISSIQGTHDFASFCSIDNSSDTTVRTIPYTTLSDIKDNIFYMGITGKGFLQHMVRIIAGTMIEIGVGKLELKKSIGVLGNSDKRNQLGMTLPGHGLILETIEYPEYEATL
jgi:tRNA pseudouridine38-40 synthase